MSEGNADKMCVLVTGGTGLVGKGIQFVVDEEKKAE